MYQDLSSPQPTVLRTSNQKGHLVHHQMYSVKHYKPLGKKALLKQAHLFRSRRQGSENHLRALSLSHFHNSYSKSYIASTQRKRVGHMLVLGAGWNRGVCRGYAYPIRGGHLYVGSFLECGPKVFVDCTSVLKRSV